MNMKYPLACLVAVVLTGCNGSSNDASQPAMNGIAEEPSTEVQTPSTPASSEGSQRSIVGTWERCTGGGLRNTYVFTQTQYQQYLAYFADLECSGQPLPSDVSPNEEYSSGSYTLGNSILSDSGVRAIEIDITAEKFLGDSIFESLRSPTYEIVFTGNVDELVFSTTYSTTEEGRPLTLDFERPYRRR